MMPLFVGRKVPRSSNSTGGSSRIDLKTGQRAQSWGDKDDPPGQLREYTTPSGAVRAAKSLVLKAAGRYDLLVFQQFPDPYLEGHVVERFVGYATWADGCARGGTA